MVPFNLIPRRLGFAAVCQDPVLRNAVLVAEPWMLVKMAIKWVRSSELDRNQ